jgi:4-amino-4-deoxy-L-arabinose transferase-like glycosyltransferase
MGVIRRRRLLDILIAALLGSAAFALYVLTLAPTVLAGDAGEFQFVPYLLGVAHPTGYPLYTLLGWAWSHLVPVGDVAYRLNLFSAFWAALAVGLVYPTARTLLRQTIPALENAPQRLIAALASATFAVTPTLWSQAVIAEVYGLHIFFVVALLLLFLTWAEQRKPRLLLAASFAFGLSLAHHSTTVLLAPAILVYLWLVNRRVFRDWRLILQALLLIVLPLSLYVLIPLRAPHTPYLRLPLSEGAELTLYDNTLAEFLEFVTGGPFGGSIDFSVDLVHRLGMTWGFLQLELGWSILVFALAGVIRLVARSCWATLALTGLTYLAVVAFNLVYTIGDIFVLYIPSYLIVVLWLAVGVGTLIEILAKAVTGVSSRHSDSETSSTKRLATQTGIVVVIILFLLPLGMGARHYADLDQSQNTRARERWEAILSEPPPSEAVLISNDRNNIMPMWYFQYVEGIRPDLLGLFPLITTEYLTLGQVLDLALDTGRPVYLIKEMPGIEVKARVAAEGDLWRVEGPAVEREPGYPRGENLGDAVRLVGYDRAPRSPQPGTDLLVSLYWEPLHPLETDYHSFVHLLDAERQVVAQSDQQPGGAYYPASLWQPGERLRDDHLLALPADLPVGVYRLLAGMYDLVEDGALEPLGDAVVIGQVGVKTEIETTPGDIPHPTRVDFAGQVELLGYDTAWENGALAVTLHWRCLGPPHADYTVFVHLLDAEGEIIAQHDGQPQNGAYPTSVCDPGEFISDAHKLPLGGDLPAGDYRLRVGLYLAETGERLAVGEGDDTVELGPVTQENREID